MNCPHCGKSLLEKEPWKDRKRDAKIFGFFALLFVLASAGMGANPFLIAFWGMCGLMLGGVFAGFVDENMKKELEAKTKPSPANRTIDL